MALTIDDVMEALQIIKELKDTELHIQTEDMKLSIFKGDVGDNARRSLDFPNSHCQVRQPDPLAAAPAAKPAEVQEQQQPVAPAPRAKPATEETTEEGLVPITASVTSVFYRRPSPDEPPFVEVGDEVEEDTPLCLLEVMKCFRQVLAGVRGRIEKICVESNHFVEKGDVLFLIRPR